MSETFNEKVKKLIATPSIYSGLKDLANEYLASVGTDKEAGLKEKLIEGIKESVMPIEEVIDFMGSDLAKEKMGDQAKEIHDHAVEVQAAGGKFCDCPACSAGKEILDSLDD
ncbi:MAG: heat-shock protein Hsp90 [Lachnospiraceae bacterium]|jgi:hypothetical protein|nr:heat-shock protein Hsp90 [Lachnospiraceae bacterium]